jgi:PAS domain S-box-containing protein
MPDNINKNSNMEEIEGNVRELLTLRTKEISENDEKFKSLLESIPALILAFDNNKNLIYANSRLETYTGYSLLDIFRNGFDSKIPDSYKSIYLEMFSRELNEDGEYLDFQFINKNNNTEWLRGLFNKVEYKKGFFGTLLVLFKIDPIKKTEDDALHTLYYKHFFRNNPDVVIIHDSDGKILEVNNTALNRLNYTEEELLKLNISDLNISINFDLFKDKKVIKDESALGLLSKMTGKKGKIIPGKFQHFIIEDKENPVYLTLFREFQGGSVEKFGSEKFEKAFGHILSHLNSGFILFNSDGYITHLSSNCENLTKIGTAAFNSSQPYMENLIETEDFTLFKENIRVSIAENIPHIQTITFKSMNSTGTKLNATILPIIENEDNNLILILKENGGKEKAEDIDFYKMLVNSAPVGIITFNKDGKYTSVNEEFLKMTAYAYKKDEILNWNINNLIDRDKILPGFVQALEGETVGYVRDYMPSPSEQKFSFYQVFAPLRNSKDEVFGVLGMLNEITDKTVIPQNFLESEERYRKIFENLEDIYIIHSSTGKINSFNPKAVEVLGYQYDEFPLMNFYELFFEKESEKIEDFLFELQSMGKAECSTSIICKDKSNIEVHISGKGIEVSGLHNYMEIIKINSNPVS